MITSYFHVYCKCRKFVTPHSATTHLKLNGATFNAKAAPLRGQRWIRTTEGVSQQIYSLPHLATLVFALIS